MAKKDKKAGKKDRSGPDPSEVVEAVRERGKGLLEEVTAAAQRIRDSFEDVRVLDDVRALRAEVEALSKRIAALEQARGSAAAPPARATAARKPAARKPAAPKADGGSKATARPRAARPAAGSTNPPAA